MSIFEALILGIVQGLTEFIPVSSSGHLVFLHEILGVTENGLVFDVALHLGTLTALLVYFRQDIAELFRDVLYGGKKRKLAWLLILATIPAAITGYLLQDIAESTFRSSGLVACTMLGFGLVMLLAEKIYQQAREHLSLDKIDLKQAIIMGLAQALALVPGVSRSGSTITAGLFAGVDRVAATRFSFLLGIPIMLGAVIKVFSEGGVLQDAGQMADVFIVGIVSALLSGLFAIKFMLRYLSQHGLHIFAYYRIAVGLFALILLGLSG